MKKLIFIIIFTLLLTGCKEKEIIEIVCDTNETLVGDECIEDDIPFTLFAPTNITFSDGILDWDDVDNAESYMVRVGGIAYFVNVSELDLSTYENGTYSAVITAKVSDLTSEESVAYEFVINVIVPIDFLNVPTNITYVSDSIVWDTVENATSYELTINGVKYQSSSNSFDFSSFENDDYTITVVAKYEAIESASSNALEFTVNIISLTPTNITIVGNILSFDEMENATSYTALINGVEYTIDETSSSLTFLDVNNSYLVSVRSNHLSTSSSYSETVEFEYYEQVLAVTSTFYKLDGTNVEFDFTTSPIINYIESNLTSFVEASYSYISGGFTVNDSYLMSLDEGALTLEVYTSAGIMNITINVVDNRKPTLSTTSNITYVVGEDIVLDFELYGGAFISLDGNGVTVNDYLVTSNTVTINSTYIDTLIAAEPDRSMIILGYYLTNDEHIIIGYVFISID